MLANIPTHLIAGPLGAGKTSLIRHLLAHKPAHERWAVLINEFGQIGLDQALLTGSYDGVSLSEIPGGCLCCVAGAPFQVGLARLLRQARPDRLLIEPSGLGHPAELLRQLVAQAGDSIEFLAGAGVSARNIPALAAQTGARAFHLSGKQVLESRMTFRREGVPMGLPGFSEFEVWQTSEQNIRAARQALDTL